MDPDTYDPYTILAQTQCTLLRLVQLPTLTKLQQFTLSESVQVELSAEALRRFLIALPQPLLAEALAAQVDAARPTEPRMPQCDACEAVGDDVCKHICGHMLCDNCAHEGCNICARNPFHDLGAETSRPSDPPVHRTCTQGCPVPGLWCGTKCHSARVGRYVSDDWCTCACHRVPAVVNGTTPHPEA